MTLEMQDLSQSAEKEPKDCGQHVSGATKNTAAVAEEHLQASELDPHSPSAWVPEGRRLLSGLLGLNVIMLGAALVAAGAFNQQGLLHQEPQMFILLLMGLSVIWMLWYLLWARKQPGRPPHMDHHAGGMTVTVVLMIFSAFSLFLHIFRMGYFAMMVDCKPLSKVLAPFIETPFLGLQTYLLWAHSKDCIHKHKVLTRSGLMLILCADLLLWLNAVTEDTLHMEIEVEKEDRQGPYSHFSFPDNDTGAEDGRDGTVISLSPLHNGWPQCWCNASTTCQVFRKGFEVLYPFNIEYYLMAGCMLYVMWKNVGRHMSHGSHVHHNQQLTWHIVHRGGIVVGPLVGLLVLLAGLTAFILYQVWVGSVHRSDAFILFYGYHLAVLPTMTICSLAGIVVYQMERRAQELGHNPTRSLDVLLLVAAALGQLSLSYFSLVAAMAVGSRDLLGSLDLAYSISCLLELVFQNIFIIEGLHRHPSLRRAAGKTWLRSSIFKASTFKKNINAIQAVDGPGEDAVLNKDKEPTSPSVDGATDFKNIWTKRAIQEICAFLILANIMMWIIPAFGAHPQFENGLGKQFYGFQAWFILVNLGQPLVVFYRMHSVSALMELLISA
ncbi:otopetrin-3-like [Arapaima gigas]